MSETAPAPGLLRQRTDETVNSIRSTIGVWEGEMGSRGAQEEPEAQVVICVKSRFKPQIEEVLAPFFALQEAHLEATGRAFLLASHIPSAPGNAASDQDAATGRGRSGGDSQKAQGAAKAVRAITIEMDEHWERLYIDGKECHVQGSVFKVLMATSTQPDRTFTARELEEEERVANVRELVAKRRFQELFATEGIEDYSPIILIRKERIDGHRQWTLKWQARRADAMGKPDFRRFRTRLA